MERNVSESKKIMAKLAIGFLIIYGAVGPASPGDDFYNWYDFAGVFHLLAIVTLLGWCLILNASLKLYKNYKDSAFRIVIGLAILGVIFYIIYNLIITLAFVMPESGLSVYFGTREAVEPKGYNWVRRSLVFSFVFVHLLRTFIGVTTILGLHRSLLDKYKNVNSISIANFIVCALILASHVFIILSSYDFYYSIFFYVYIVLQIAFCIYIYSMKNKVNIEIVRDNGSIFNRIPEEEYQEFLEKMK